jgi:hypothetical protein
MHKAETEALVKLELRLSECERRLPNAEGETNALEYAVRALVASSANPTAVRLAWAHLMPMIVDIHVPPQPTLQCGLSAWLASWTEVRGRANRRFALPPRDLPDRERLLGPLRELLPTDDRPLMAARCRR